METQERRSSIVAIKVSNFVLHLIDVRTLEPSLLVLISKPWGSFTLSGNTALETASASLSLLYESTIAASKLGWLQLLFDELIYEFDEGFHVFDRYLSSCSDVVASSPA